MTNVRTSRLTAFAILMVLALVALACGDDGDDSTSGASGGGPTSATSDDSDGEDPVEVADRNAALRVTLHLGSTNLDPHRYTAPQDLIWMRPVYDRLVTIVNGENGVELAPQLARSWEFSPDGLSLELELRDDVTFQDGARFDADVVKANIDRALGEGSTVASTLASVESVEVVDSTHAVFRLGHRDPAIPWTFATGSSGMMVSPNALGNADLASNPVGSGPFKLVSWAKDADVVYERWDGHWDPDAALVRRLTIRTIADVNARYNGVQAGEFDIALVQAPLDSQAQSLAPQGYHVDTALAPISYGIRINTAKAPFDDVRVRRAVSMALNRKEISKELFDGINPPAYQPFLEGYLGYDPALDDDPYDPEAARRLVTEAGAEGAMVQLLASTVPPTNLLAEVVQQSLDDIGLNAELVPISPTEATSIWRRGSHHGLVAVIFAYAEPSLTLATSYFGADSLGEPPAQLVEMADEGVELPAGSAEREQKYRDISAYLVENPIHVPIATYSTTMLSRPEVVGSRDVVVEVLANIDFRRVGVAAS